MRKYVFWIALLMCFLPQMLWAFVARDVNKANDLYRQGKFDDSLKWYQKALDANNKSAIIKYDLADALYKKGNYSQALMYLEQAFSDKNAKITPRIEYNLANTLYKSAIQKENTHIDQAMDGLEDALGHYSRVIAQNPKDSDAVFNQDFVKKEIQRLRLKKHQQEERQRQNKQSPKDGQQQKSSANQEGKQSSSKKNDQKSSAMKNLNDKKQEEKQRALDARNQKKDKAQQEAQTQKELDRQQAQDLLEEYQENEEPKKLLNYMPKKIDDRPLVKDW